MTLPHFKKEEEKQIKDDLKAGYEAQLTREARTKAIISKMQDKDVPFAHIMKIVIGMVATTAWPKAEQDSPKAKKGDLLSITSIKIKKMPYRKQLVFKQVQSFEADFRKRYEADKETGLIIDKVKREPKKVTKASDIEAMKKTELLSFCKDNKVTVGSTKVADLKEAALSSLKKKKKGEEVETQEDSSISTVISLLDNAHKVMADLGLSKDLQKEIEYVMMKLEKEVK